MALFGSVEKGRRNILCHFIKLNDNFVPFIDDMVLHFSDGTVTCF